MSHFSKFNFGTRIQYVASKFIGVALIFLAFLFFSSALGIVLAAQNHNLTNDILRLVSLSFLADLGVFAKIFFPAMIIYIFLGLLIPKITHKIFIVLSVVFFAVHIMLTYYHNTTMVMLGSDLFGYSLDEISQTVGSSGAISIVPVIIMVSFLGLLILGFVFIDKNFNISNIFTLSFILFSGIFLLPANTGDSALILKSDFESSLVRNKSSVFFSSSFDYLFPYPNEVDIYAESYAVDISEKLYAFQDIEFLDETNYPFLHSKTQRDVLSPFFSLKKQEPNIVIILVEGMGRAFANKGAYLGNFTPFLDSLASESLYWKNGLSNGGRTFAVLPSVLGSLPFGETGFSEIKPEIPKHFSLLNIFKNNGYTTSFFYGGNSRFDNMRDFLEMNGITNVADENTFPKNYQKIPAENGFSWGYGDKELFRYYLEETPRIEDDKPRLDVILTVSTHSPFVIEDKERYIEKFNKRLRELNLEPSMYKNYERQYSSVLYTDDALKNLFNEFSKREDFDNTIFIITGDHRIPEIPMATKIDRYHVPILIYSPLLERTAEISAITSHFDLAPSILNLMASNYNFTIPEVQSFLGQGLDTIRAFRNINAIPLKQTKTELIDFVLGEYHLNGEHLFRLTSAMDEIPVDDPEKLEELKAALNNFKRKNSEINNTRQIIPDSIYLGFSRN